MKIVNLTNWSADEMRMLFYFASRYEEKVEGNGILFGYILCESNQKHSRIEVLVDHLKVLDMIK